VSRERDPRVLRSPNGSELRSASLRDRSNSPSDAAVLFLNFPPVSFKRGQGGRDESPPDALLFWSFQYVCHVSRLLSKERIRKNSERVKKNKPKRTERARKTRIKSERTREDVRPQ